MEINEEDVKSLDDSIKIFLSEFGENDIYSKILLEEFFLLIKNNKNGISNKL